MAVNVWAGVINFISTVNNMNVIKYNLLLLSLVLFLTGCAQMTKRDTIRTITLDGESYSENKLGQFVSWGCRDSVHRGNILVEVGNLHDTNFTALEGFVLYDGTDTGSRGTYLRQGLNLLWNWGYKGQYAFILEPDGTGLFYDFSNTKEGESKKADSVYKCSKI